MSSLKQATEIYSREFDSIFFRLPPKIQKAVETAIRDMGSRLDNYGHVRLQGREEFRMRVGDYRVIYEFDLRTWQLHLITMGHRRDIYR